MFVVVLKLSLVKSSLAVDHKSKPLNQIIHHPAYEINAISDLHDPMLIK